MFAESLDAFLDETELAAISLMREQFQVDVARTYQFWESAVSRIITGQMTPHGCPWDVELDYFGSPICIEVKFSQEFDCRFRAGVRPVFKFAAPRGEGREKASAVTVLVGIDSRDDVHTWVIPSAALPRVASITLTSPRARLGGSSRSAVDAWRCPPTQLLPEVLYAWRCHLHYDRDHHRETALATRRAMLAAQGQGELFPDLPG